MQRRMHAQAGRCSQFAHALGQSLKNKLFIRTDHLSDNSFLLSSLPNKSLNIPVHFRADLIFLLHQR